MARHRLSRFDGMSAPRELAAGAILLLAAIAVAACGGGSDPTPAPTPTSTPTTTAASGATRTPTATRTPAPTATPADEASAASGERTITNIRDLVGAFGDPPGTTFARLRIPLLGVDGPVSSSTVSDGGVMSAPYNPVEVTWYDMRLWPGMGGRPGEGGNAIFSGHVDYAAHIAYADGVYYRGKGIFGSLELLSPGDIVEVVYDGQVLRYAVKWQRDVAAVGGDWAAIWSSDVAVDSITLYTCGGDFDFGTRQYSHRVVVRAERIS